MLLSAVSVLVVAQSSSEIPEGLMSNPVYSVSLTVKKHPLPFGYCECYDTETSFYFSWEATSGQHSASLLPNGYLNFSFTAKWNDMGGQRSWSVSSFCPKILTKELVQHNQGSPCAHVTASDENLWSVSCPKTEAFC